MREYIITTEKGANQQLHELIRCRECRYWKYEDSGVDGTSVGECCWVHILSEGTFYCAGAERKEE